jgi:hypothetical protein
MTKRAVQVGVIGRGFGARVVAPDLTQKREWADIICDSVRGGRAAPDTPTFADGLACSRVMNLRGEVEPKESHRDEERI